MTLTELLSALTDPRIRHELVVHYGLFLALGAWTLFISWLYNRAWKDGDE